MAGYFGFKPTAALSDLIDRTDKAFHSNAPVREQRDLRDRLVKDIVNELITNLMRDVVGALPPGDKRDQLLKVTETVASTAEKLISQILEKDDEKILAQNHKFLTERTLFTDAEGNRRIGFKMNDALYAQITGVFALIREGKGEAHRPEVIEALNQFTGAVLDHFMMDFTATLDLGFIKRKLLPVAHGVIMGGVKMMNSRLIPKLGQKELERFEARYSEFMYSK